MRARDPRDEAPEPHDAAPARGRWGPRVLVLVAAVLGAFAVWVANGYLTQRFTDTTRTRAELRAALFSGNLLSELQRTAVVPLLLARDPAVVAALTTNDYARLSANLISAEREIGVASILLLDINGRVVGATRRQLLRANLAQEAYFVDALRARETLFTVTASDTSGMKFAYSRAVTEGGKVLGVIVVGAELARLERAWAGVSDAAAVTDSEGRVILSTEPRWRGLTLDQALAAEGQTAGSAIARAFQATAGWTFTTADAFLRDQPVMRTETRVPFRGWRLSAFTSTEAVRQRVNAILALVVMGVAVLLAAAFYFLSQRARRQSAAFARESADLRALNARLTREVEERQRVQRELRVAEQTVQQSSKLAALGEMSAGVSHELNQPLAAMKTYLAGARLLLQRARPEEALSSFQRIDDLIERMSAITRQLKSFARKGGEAFEPVDLRDALSGALSLMESQLRARGVRVARAVPRGPVLVRCDRIRLEQVIINLLRNAADATRGVAQPRITITLTSGASAQLAVRDNGPGVADLDRVFEPFWTTKAPGEGTGLGLAISSGIVADFGGRLTAQNPEGGGALFEVELPLHVPDLRSAVRPATTDATRTAAE